MKKGIIILIMAMLFSASAKMWEFKGLGKDNHFPSCHSIICPVCRKYKKNQTPQVARKVTKGLDVSDDGQKYVIYVCTAGHYSKFVKE